MCFTGHSEEAHAPMFTFSEFTMLDAVNFSQILSQSVPCFVKMWPQMPSALQCIEASKSRG